MDYQDDLDAILEGLEDLMADLEDIRDEAQDAAEEGEQEAAALVARLDRALTLFSQAAFLLENEE